MKQQFTMKYPIYIPSKGRAETCLTPHILIREEIEFYLVVEPQDFVAYSNKFQDTYILILPENNMGLEYARNFIKQHSIKYGHKYHWQIDDNIKKFMFRYLNVNTIIEANYCFEVLEYYVNEYSNIGIAGLRHVMYAWSQKHDYTFNNQCPSCILINNDVDVHWRKDVVEDTDYSLQVLSKNYCTIIFNRLIFDKPPIKTISGGCTDIYYKNNVQLSRQKKLQEFWPGYFNIKIQDNVSRVKPSKIWKTFKQQPIKII